MKLIKTTPLVLFSPEALLSHALLDYSVGQSITQTNRPLVLSLAYLDQHRVGRDEMGSYCIQHWRRCRETQE